MGGPPFPFGGRAGVGESFSPGRGARAGGPSNTGDSLCNKEILSRVQIVTLKKKENENKKKLTNLLVNPVPNAAKGSLSLVKELGVVKLLGKALVAPDTNPEELKLLNGSKESCNINKDKGMQKQK